MRFEKFDSKDDFVKSSVELIVDVCKEKDGKVYIGLSGGKTPLPVYGALVKYEDVDYSWIEFFVVDERYVPLVQEESNYYKIMKTLNHEIVKSLDYEIMKSIRHFDTSLSIEASLQDYEGKLQEIPNQQFDLIILGMGGDGHVASVFLHSGALKSKRLVEHTQTEKFAVKDRLTMTFEIIMKAKKILLLVSGEEKKEAVDELLHGDESFEQFPAKKLLEHSDLNIFYFK